MVYISYSLLNFPKIISKIFPFVLFLAFFYVTTKYELNNELMIFWNHGIHKIEIINLIFKVSFFLMLFQMLLTCFVVPSSQDLARSFLRTSEVNFFDNFVKPQKFNDNIKGITIYTDKKDKNGNLNNLYLKKEDNNQFQITYAKKGEFKEIGNTPLLVLYDGATITLKDNKLTNISFSKSDFSLLNVETNTTTYKKTQEISSLKLFTCLNNFYKFDKNIFQSSSEYIENCNIQNINNIFKEFYKRTIIPFYIPALSLLPLLLIMVSKESSSYQKLRLITFLIGLFVIIFSETTIRFITSVPIQNIILFISPAILFLSIYLFFRFKFTFKSKSI